MRHRVFISYYAGDRETAERICSSLESSGIACWIAPRDVLPGANYATVIVEAIEECKVFVVLLSAGSMHSAQVAREVERASSKSIPVIPFRLDSAPLSKAMEYFLSSSQWIDASSPTIERHVKVLVSAVFSILTEWHSDGEPLSADVAGNAPSPADVVLRPGVNPSAREVAPRDDVPPVRKPDRPIENSSKPQVKARRKKGSYGQLPLVPRALEPDVIERSDIAKQGVEEPTSQETEEPAASAERPRTRYGLIPGVLVAVALLSCIVLLALWKHSSDGAQISLTSDPPGAAVFLNGEGAGQTPLIDHSMRPGTVIIRLVHPSRPARDTTIGLAPGVSMSVFLRLPVGESAASKTSEASKSEMRKSGRTGSNKNSSVKAGGAIPQRLATDLSGAAGILLTSLHALVPQEPVLVTVLPFMYKKTQIGAEISVAIKEALEEEVPQLGGWRMVALSLEPVSGHSVLRGMTPRSDATHMLKGVYREEGTNIRVQAALVRTRDKIQLGESSVLLPRSAVPAALLPANYTQVANMLKTIASGAVTSTDLRLECWTNKGKENLIFRDKESMQVFVRVNMPCFLRFIYHVADGTHLLMTIPDIYVSESEVGKPFLLGYSLTITQPFGGEALQIFARTKTFPPLRDPQNRTIKESLEELLATNRRANGDGGPLYQTEDCIVITTVKQ